MDPFPSLSYEEGSSFYYDTENSSLFYNESFDGLCDLNPDSAQAVTQIIIYSITCISGLIGNLLVMMTYLFYKKAKTMTDVYLFNVAAADLLFVLALPFIIYNEQNSWPMGGAACKLLSSSYSINLYSGMLLLACISGDRYVAIVQARRSFGSRSQGLTYSWLICLAVWVVSLALTLPTIFHTQLREEDDLFDGNRTVTCQLDFDNDNTAKVVKVLVPSLQMAIGFLMPLVVMGFCYSCVMWTLWRAQSSQRHKAIRVVLAVVVVFVVCHLPYNVTLLIRTLLLFKPRGCEDEKIRLKVLDILRSVAYLHCCLNPILYAFIGVKFRSRFLQILSDLWCLGRKFISSGRSPRATSDICNSGQMRTSDTSNNMSSFSA